ncbi:unnamed protein product, partial [Cuscuta europaea]
MLHVAAQTVPGIPGGSSSFTLDVGTPRSHLSQILPTLCLAPKPRSSRIHFFVVFTENQSILYEFFVEHQEHMNLFELIPTDGASVEFNLPQPGSSTPLPGG